MKRIWVLTNIPSPYQLELLGSVAALQTVGLDVRFMSGRLPDDFQAAAGSSFVRMSGIGLSRSRDELRLHIQALRECRSGDWDIYVLSGTWASPTVQACASILTRRGKAWILWSERPHPSREVAPWSRRWIATGPLRIVRDKAVRRMLKKARGVLAIGKQAVAEYVALGVAPEKIRSLPYCCDVDRFSNCDKEEVRRIRMRPELHNRRVILFSGQLIERKGIRTLAAVFRKVAERVHDAAFVALGDGPMRPWLEQQLAPILDRVVMPGRLNQSELPVWFGAADVFYFPSRHDGWGVVINEACGAGLPIVTTTSTGAAADLVCPGENGYVLDRDDCDGFVDALVRLATSEELRSSMGSRSRSVISEYRVAPAAERWIQSVTYLADPNTGP